MHERRRLVEACVEVGDQVSSEMLREMLTDALGDVGVRPYDPRGERFDPQRHAAAGTLPTGDPALDGTIGATQRVGYRDGDDVVRHPEVLVYRHRDV